MKLKCKEENNTIIYAPICLCTYFTAVQLVFNPFSQFVPQLEPFSGSCNRGKNGVHNFFVNSELGSKPTYM